MAEACIKCLHSPPTRATMAGMKTASLAIAATLLAGLLGFAIGRLTAPTDKVTNNEEGLIRIIATQQVEIDTMKKLIATYKEAFGEPDKVL